MSERHHGVVVIVTNPRRARFLVQQKDDQYPVFPRGFSLFGGAIEPGERPEQALVRELYEELGAAAEHVVGARPRLVLATEVPPRKWRVSLFEAVVPDDRLEALAQTPVLEGERGVLFDRERLPEVPFVWGLSAVVRTYLEGLDADEPGS